MQLKKYNFIVLSLLFFFFVAFSAEKKSDITNTINKKYQEVYPEDDYKIINISQTDINRIYCPEGISYYQTSLEKYLAISFAESGKDEIKKNMFLKIKPKILTSETGVDEKILYDSTPKELYIKCGNILYTFILKPLKIPARTIYIRGISREKDIPAKQELAKENIGKEKSNRLTNTSLNISAPEKRPEKRLFLERKGNMQKANSFEKKMNSYEETLLMLVKYVLKKGSIPGYAEYKYLGIVDRFKQGNLILNKFYEGPMYRVYLYTFVASVDIEKPLREIDFAYLSKKPLAISISDLTIKKGEATTIVIVESSRNPIMVIKISEGDK